MNTCPIQQNNNSFKALKNIKFKNNSNPIYSFNPKCSIKDAEIVDAFMKNDAFNKVFKDYDAWATFYIYERFGMPYHCLNIVLKEADTAIPQKNLF